MSLDGVDGSVAGQSGLPGAGDDLPLPGLECVGVHPAGVGSGGYRECVDPVEQGGPLPSMWDVQLTPWSASSSALGSGLPAVGDPLPLTGGQTCDRCSELAMVATEHVWAAPVPHELADLVGAVVAAPAGRWVSGTLYWCRAHLRESEWALLAGGAVVVGTRG